MVGDWVDWRRIVVAKEFCYNASFQTAIRMSPFEAVYNMPPPTLLSYIPGTAKTGEIDGLLRQRDQLLRELRDNLTTSQMRMKHYHDLRRRDVEFKVGQQVYLKLQPYRQHPLRTKKGNKLAARFYGPFISSNALARSLISYNFLLIPSFTMSSVSLN